MYADDITLMTEIKEELKSLLMKVKEESEKASLKLNIQIDSQWEFAVWLRNLKQWLCINLEGWEGVGDRREVQKGGDIYTYIPMADTC